MKQPDDNDRAMAGTLPADPFEGTHAVLPDAPPPTAPADPEPPRPPAPPRVLTMAELRASTRAQVLRRQAGEEKPIETPWPAVNAALGGGFWPGFYTLTSGTGAGKTQWALAVALAAAVAGLPAHYVALELSGEEVYSRLLALAARTRSGGGIRVPWSELYRGQNPDALSFFEDPGAALDALPLGIEVAPPQGWPAERLTAIAATPEPPRLIVVDFLQLLAATKGEDPAATMSRVAYAARAVARDHHCTVLALSSTARANYAATAGTADDGKPGQGDPGRYVGLGKYAGDLEFAADGVLALVGDGEFDKALGGRRIHVAVAKNRGGPAAWCPPMRFDGCTFEPETAETTPPASAPKPSKGTPKPPAAQSFRDRF